MTMITPETRQEIRGVFESYKKRRKRDLEKECQHTCLDSGHVSKKTLITALLRKRFGAWRVKQAFEPQDWKERKQAARKLIDQYFADQTDTVRFRPETPRCQAGYEVFLLGYTVLFVVTETGRIQYVKEYLVDKDRLIQDIVKIRYAVRAAGGRITTQTIMRGMVDRFPHIDRALIRTALAEVKRKHLEQERFWAPGCEPSIEDYPELEIKPK